MADTSIGQASTAATSLLEGVGKFLDLAGQSGYGVNAMLAPLAGFTRPRKAFRSTNDEPLAFQALVDDFEFTEEALFADYDTISDGEHSQRGLGKETDRKCRRLTLSVLAMDYHPTATNRYPWIVSTARTARVSHYDTRIALQDILRARDPVFLYARVPRAEHSELKMPVTVRSMRYTVRPGLPGARFIALELVEFRDGSVERATVSYSSLFPKTHKVADGDTYLELAQRYYGSPSLWRTIARANPSFPSSVGSVNLVSVGVPVGRSLRIPAPPKNTGKR